MFRFKYHKRFSTYLMTAFVVLVSVSVIVILGTLYRNFGKKVEAEFYEKLRAQKGQVEIILKNRMASIRNNLDELRSDNIIRVTVLLGDTYNLSDRITQSYPPKDGVYHFVKKVGEKQIVPQKYAAISEKIVTYAIAEYPDGKMLQDEGKTRILWIFSGPVMHETGRMGTAFALYDMLKDQNLLETIEQAGGISLAAIHPDQAFDLMARKVMVVDPQIREQMAGQTGFVPFGRNLVLSKISGFKHLYFQSSLESLIQEKHRVTVWMRLFAIVVLAVSTLMAVFLARKMVAPLRKMTAKAIQISEGQKDLLFETNRRNYWEFNQLSEAFNYMLANLKDAKEQTRYKELLEMVDDAVYIMDLDGNILEANEAA